MDEKQKIPQNKFVVKISLLEYTYFSFDIRRYCPDVSANTRWVKERSHEAYAKNYAMVFPHDEPLAGRNMKKVQMICKTSL